MKVNRKSTPKMVVRPHFISDYEKFQRESERQQRFELTIASLIGLVIALILLQVIK